MVDRSSLQMHLVSIKINTTTIFSVVIVNAGRIIHIELTLVYTDAPTLLMGSIAVDGGRIVQVQSSVGGRVPKVVAESSTIAFRTIVADARISVSTQNGSIPYDSTTILPTLVGANLGIV